jgi:hypothetical protein
MNEKRTWDEFAEEMFEKGRSKSHVIAVCLGSRWWDNRHDIIKHIKHLKKFFKKSKKSVSHRG